MISFQCCSKTDTEAESERRELNLQEAFVWSEFDCVGSNFVLPAVTDSALQMGVC